MIHLTITLTWPDGDTLTARMQAETPEGDNPVAYTGATQRVPDIFQEDSAPLLASHLRVVAHQTGAKIDEKWDGTYERHAR